MSSYRLAPAVHVCASAQGAVFLDVHRDSFLGLDAHQSQALLQVLGTHDGDVTAEALDFARALCDRGLLERADTATPTQGALLVPEAMTQLLPWERMRMPQLRWHHVVTFAQAWARACVLSRGGFSRIVDRIERHRNDIAGFDPREGRRLLAIYCHLRVFAFGKKGRCLLDSLTLLEFLAAYGLRPTWIIGVQIRPFGSHCWLQYHSAVLNGTPGYVRAYRPILAI